MSLSVHWCVSKASIHHILKEVYSAIINEFCTEQLNLPRTQEEWVHEADEFYRQWDLPNCVGAIDGKHIRIRCPANGGSNYFNYKKFHSILLLAVVDSKLRFRENKLHLLAFLESMRLRNQLKFDVETFICLK